MAFVVLELMVPWNPTCTQNTCYMEDATNRLTLFKISDRLAQHWTSSGLIEMATPSPPPRSATIMIVA